jgi:hypothetical protein
LPCGKSWTFAAIGERDATTGAMTGGTIAEDRPIPKTRVRVPFTDFGGGLNEDASPAVIQASELRVARNVYLEGRALASRQGAQRFQTASINGSPGVGIWELVRASGVSRDILTVFGTHLYKDAKSATPTDITGTVVITPGQNNHVTFTLFNDVALMCNGVDPPWQWDGGTAEITPDSPPTFRTMAAKWNRVFGAAAGRTIRYSDIGDHETWPPGNTVAAILGDASSAIEGRDYIYQMGHLGDSLFVGLSNSIGRVLYTGDTTTPFRYLQLADFGSLGRHSYVSVGQNGYFLSRWGVHYVTPSNTSIDYETSLISGRRLQTFWRELNKTRIEYTYGRAFYTQKGNLLVVWNLTTGGNTQHDQVLVMDVTDGPGTEKFFLWSGWDANTFGVVQNPSTRVDELLFTSVAGMVWQGDFGTDDAGAAYVTDACTRWEDGGATTEKKNLRDMYVELRQSGDFGVTIQTFFDYSTTATQTLTQSVAGRAQAVWDSAIWDTDVWATLGIVRGNLFGVDDGMTISWRFMTVGANQPWTLLKFVPAVEAIGEASER